MKDRVTIGLAVALLIAMAAELVWHPHAPVFPWHHLPGFQGVIGVVSCIVVVLVSKALGKLFLQGPEPEGEERADGP